MALFLLSSVWLKLVLCEFFSLAGMLLDEPAVKCE